MHKPLIVVPLLLMIALCCTLSSQVQAACSCQCVNGQLQLYCGPSDDIRPALYWSMPPAFVCSA